MKAYIKERTLEVARHIADTQDTVRKTAEIYHLSKSTVHNDVSTRLEKIDKPMYEQVQQVMQKNFAEKHIRGGMSTKEKYERAK